MLGVIHQSVPEWWLSADLVAYFGHAVGSKVHEPIMSDGGEAAHAAAKCMLYSEGGTIGA